MRHLTGHRRLAAALFTGLLLLAPCPLALPQVSRRDLDGLEQHRKPPQPVAVLQSIGDDSPTASSLIGTWDFLDEEERGEEERADRGNAGVPTPIGKETLESRLSVLAEEIRIPYNETLEDYVVSYVVRHARSMRGVLGKYLYYEKTFRRTFEANGIPGDIAALAIVESAMNPLALSKAGARGMWQFMPGTARRYGLRCDYSVDERLDIHRSAEAAAKYLRNSYRQLHDWPLAVSAYNCGLNNVLKAVEAAGTTDFWSVYPFLPSETKGYMPALIAALYTVYYHETHGITPKRFSEGDLAVFRITRDMTFKEIIRATGMEMDELTRLNPQYLTGIIPGNDRTYTLKIPRRYATLFKDNIDVVTR